MALVFCKPCKREVTPKFRIFKFLSMLVLVPIASLIMNFISGSLSGWLFFLVFGGATIWLAAKGYMGICPICRTPVKDFNELFLKKNKKK